MTQQEKQLTFEEYLKTIKQVELPEKLENLSEKEYILLSIDLFKEVGYLVSSISLVSPPNGTWKRNQAIIIGHFVRLFKLLSAQLDQACKNRFEIAVFFSRPIFECILNTKYFLQNYPEPAVFDEYVRHSLRIYKEWEDRIKQDRAELDSKNSDVLLIRLGERLLKSSQKKIEQEKEEIEDIVKVKSWGEKTVYERSKKVGFEGQYLACFKEMSHTIHGTWNDIRDYHLICYNEDSYKANNEWTQTKPQLILTTSFLCTELLLDQNMSKILGTQDTNNLYERGSGLSKKIQLVDRAHESKIQSSQ